MYMQAIQVHKLKISAEAHPQQDSATLHRFRVLSASWYLPAQDISAIRIPNYVNVTDHRIAGLHVSLTDISHELTFFICVLCQPCSHWDLNFDYRHLEAHARLVIQTVHREYSDYKPTSRFPTEDCVVFAVQESGGAVQWKEMYLSQIHVVGVQLITDKEKVQLIYDLLAKATHVTPPAELRHPHMSPPTNASPTIGEHEKGKGLAHVG